MKKTLFSLLAVLMVLSLVVTACGPTAEPTEAPEMAEDLLGEPAPEPPQQPAPAPQVENGMVDFEGQGGESLGLGDAPAPAPVVEEVEGVSAVAPGEEFDLTTRDQSPFFGVVLSDQLLSRLTDKLGQPFMLGDSISLQTAEGESLYCTFRTPVGSLCGNFSHTFR